MFLAEQLPTLSAIDVAVDATQTPSAHGIRASVVGPGSLPMLSCYEFIRVYWSLLDGLRCASSVWRRSRQCSFVLVCLEDVKTFELLV